MKIQSLQLDNFMLFDSLNINWSPNINIICGENSTGKTTLLKVLYSVLKTCNRKQMSELTKDQIEDLFVSKMIGVFRPDEKIIGRLVSRKRGSNKTSIVINFFQNNDSISVSFSNRSERHAEIDMKRAGEWKAFEPVYLPPKEMISATEHFQSLYEQFNIDFEEMYFDLTKLLDRPLKRGANTTEQSQVLSNFENILEGNIVQKDRKFYLKVHGAGEFEMGLVSEGYRKLATIIYLIISDSLTKNSVLFWDEPETNMNPKMIQYIVAAIVELAKMGVQVFVTTHDYFVLQSFNLLASYPKSNTSKIKIQFVSLYKDEENKQIKCEVANDLSGLNHNAIMEEFDALYDREQGIIYGDK